jgi:hypothetical protein
MDALTCAYLAGVMDSDGWFTIKRHAANALYCESFTYSEYAGCGQAQSGAIDLLHEAFGGSVRLRSRKEGPDWRPMYYWVASNKQAAPVAIALRPYLRLKAEQADLIIALRASKDAPRRYDKSAPVRLRGRRLDPEVVAERHAAYLRIRALNDRRPSNLAVA